mgnify:CR=1 FL=1
MNVFYGSQRIIPWSEKPLKTFLSRMKKNSAHSTAHPNQNQNQFPSRKVNKITRLQINNSHSLQVNKVTSPQGIQWTCQQVHKYTQPKIHKRTSPPVHMFTTRTPNPISPANNLRPRPESATPSTPHRAHTTFPHNTPPTTRSKPLLRNRPDNRTSSADKPTTSAPIKSNKSAWRPSTPDAKYRRSSGISLTLTTGKTGVSNQTRMNHTLKPLPKPPAPHSTQNPAGMFLLTQYGTPVPYSCKLAHMFTSLLPSQCTCKQVHSQDQPVNMQTSVPQPQPAFVQDQSAGPTHTQHQASQPDPHINLPRMDRGTENPFCTPLPKSAEQTKIASSPENGNSNISAFLRGSYEEIG